MKSILLLGLSLFICGCAMGNDSKNESIIQSQDSQSVAETPRTNSNQTNQRKLKPLTFAFTGDIMMGTTYPENGNYLPPNDGADIFKDVTEVLSSADLAAGNLEGTLLDGKGQVKKCGNPSLCYAFRMPTRYVNHLKNAGYDFVGIANNHINDFGPEGLSTTQKTLKDNGILYAGLKATCPTAVTEVDGVKVGFAAFGHNNGTMSILKLNEVEETVRKLKDECDIVVVSFHGGGEGKGFQHVPHKTETCFGENRGDVEAFAHTAIDAGADVVYGHGPHVNRALELYKDHLIMYSLGNFCTPYRVSLVGVSGYAPVVTVTLNPDGTFDSGKIHSFIQQTGMGPRKDPTNSVAKNMKNLSMADFPKSPLIISDDGTLTRK